MLIKPLTLFIILVGLFGSRLPEVSCDAAAAAFGREWVCADPEAVGSGGFSQSFRVFSKVDGRRRIVKVTLAIDPNRKIRLMNEIKFLKTLNHPNIIGLEEGKEVGNFVLQLLDDGDRGDLFDFSKDHPELFKNPEFTLKIWTDVVLGVQYLHSKNKIHGDLKLENVVLQTDEDGNLVAKLIDFDMAKPAGQVKGLSGTEGHFAPECLTTKGKCLYTESVDVFQLGLMLYLLIHDRLPYPDLKDTFKLWDHLQKSTYKIKYETEMTIAELIEGCLQADPNQRLTVDNIIDYLKRFDQQKDMVFMGGSVLKFTELSNPIFWKVVGMKPKKTSKFLDLGNGNSQGVQGPKQLVKTDSESADISNLAYSLPKHNKNLLDLLNAPTIDDNEVMIVEESPITKKKKSSSWEVVGSQKEKENHSVIRPVPISFARQPVEQIIKPKASLLQNLIPSKFGSGIGTRQNQPAFPTMTNMNQNQPVIENQQPLNLGSAFNLQSQGNFKQVGGSAFTLNPNYFGGPRKLVLTSELFADLTFGHKEDLATVTGKRIMIGIFLGLLFVMAAGLLTLVLNKCLEERRIKSRDAKGSAAGLPSLKVPDLWLAAQTPSLDP